MKINRMLIRLIWLVHYTGFALFVGAQGIETKFDTASKKIGTNLSPKPYDQIITSKAITDTGLFLIHRIEDKYFFEIPKVLLGRDLLLVNRIIEAPAGSRRQQSTLGFSGDEIGEKIVRFERGPRYKLFLRELSGTDRAEDSSGNGMFRSVMRSNILSIILAFDIKAFSPDSSSVLIDVTDLIAGDNNILFFENKKPFNITGAMQADRSFIESVKSFPINIEIATVKTFAGDPIPKTFALNSSIVLLPRDTMKPRLADERVGYFLTGYTDYDANPQGIEQVSLVTRWRLEPKEADIPQYVRGELVEPKQPIVYYIDPATPKKWVPYLIQGVNDWQVAFEQAGFKHAIYALEAPVIDPDWSLYDARHNAIIYKPSDVSNASGPMVRDPRTGEIIETHVNWYHNVMQLIRDWYLIQVAPNDPRARTLEFPDSLMGQLIRFVSSHEVGHTLGLMHNFGASATVPVEFLRNKKWVEENGFCPSIMDYARFNYVAQPQDSIGELGLMPRIGLYDKWAIDWGYRWFPKGHFRSKKEEVNYMVQWVTDQLKKDKRYIYGRQQVFGVTDPRNQSEDLGDNAMQASYYGIENLKRIVPQLIHWTTQDAYKDYTGLRELDQQLISQYSRYISHVVNNIGLYTWDYPVVGDNKNTVGFISKAKQKQAVAFLQKELFDTPEWLMDKNIFYKIGGKGPLLPLSLQLPVLNKIMSNATYTNLVFFQGQEGEKAYSFDELLTDLEKGIWRELSSCQPIDFYRRHLQKAYAERLLELVSPITSIDPMEKLGGYSMLRMDISTLVRMHARHLMMAIDKCLPNYTNGMSREHLFMMRDRLREGLKTTFGKENANENSKSASDNTGLRVNTLPQLVSPNSPSY